MKKASASLLVFFVSISFVHAQADAGPDRIKCPTGTITLAGVAVAGACYSWSPKTGLDDPNILNPTCSATATTTYTLTVVEAEFSNKTTDNMVVTVLPAAQCCGANAVVSPTSNPTVNNGAASNDCTPAQPTLMWNACYLPADELWHARVSALNCTGIINIANWPSAPAMMIVPNTANPVAGGNINNMVGSNNRWSYAKADMADYDVAGGGAGPHWHSTGASSAHENFHWNTDWMVSSIGAFWGAGETNIEAITANAATQAAAVTAMTPMVNTAFTTYRGNATNHWNTVIGPADVPGGGGGGYAAGMGVLNGLIAAVEAFRVANGW